MNTYRIWISCRKESTLVIREFSNVFEAQLWMAARHNVKTYDVIAKRISKAELALMAEKENN